MPISRILGVLAVSALAAAAQTPDLVGPVTGYIFDSSNGTLRAMLGIPGAAHMGGVMATGLAAASVSPDGSMALGTLRSGKLLLYTGLRGGRPNRVPVAGALAGANLFAWSAGAGAAAIYSSGGKQAQVLSGLPASPSAAASVDLSALPGPVTALVFDGEHIVLAASGEGGGIFLGSQRIAAAVHPSAMALSGANLFFADAQAQQIWHIANFATAAAPMQFSSAGVNDPVGMQVSADGKRLLVANAGDQKLEVYDIAARSLIQTVDLVFKPARLDRFGDASVFLMKAGGDGPNYVARDDGPGKASVYFVPSGEGRRPQTSPMRRP